MSQAKLFVGIDVASRKFDVSFLDADKKSVRPIATYANDHAGWTALIDTLEALSVAHGPVLCGMESTGSWHKHLERRLGEHKRTSIGVCTLNPYGVKHFARALLMDSKTDKTDSKLIALYLVHMNPEPNYRPIPGNEELKEATRSRRRLIEDRTQAKNRLHKLMNSHYPGYRNLVGETFTVRLLTLLSEMQSPCAILAHTVEDLAERSTGHRHRMGAEFAAKLHELARLAPQQALSTTTELLIQMGAQRILQLSVHLRELDKCIDRMLGEMYPDQHLTSIPGIGPVSAAAILAEVGDVTRFTDKTQFRWLLRPLSDRMGERQHQAPLSNDAQGQPNAQNDLVDRHGLCSPVQSCDSRLLRAPAQTRQINQGGGRRSCTQTGRDRIRHSEQERALVSRRRPARSRQGQRDAGLDEPSSSNGHRVTRGMARPSRYTARAHNQRFPQHGTRLSSRPIPAPSMVTKTAARCLFHLTNPIASSQPGSPRDHARLASGWWLPSTGRGWLPAGFDYRFRHRLHDFLRAPVKPARC